MTIDSIDVDLDNVLSLGQWLESEEARIAQRQLEAKIAKMLFSHDPTSPDFQTMAAELAWIGSRPEAKPLIEREILALNFPNGYSVESCGLFKDIGKAGRAVGHFVSGHLVEIAVGAAICATGVGIAVATGYAISASVGGVVVAGAGSVFHPEKKTNPHIPLIPLPNPNACSQGELAAIQEGLPITLPKIDLPSSLDEVLVTADGVWANGQFFSTDGIMKDSIFSSVFQKNTLEGSLGFPMDSRGSEWKTFHAYFSRQQEVNGDYQTRGKSALALGNYNQAVHDLEKAIEANPSDPIAYLERGSAYFGLGEYDRSLEDYQHFTSQIQTANPLSLSEFCLGFVKGLPKGTYESGEGILLFLVDFVKHPIQTSKQAIDSITLLVDLIRRDEWGAVAGALTPEVHQLVTEWDTLSSDQRGALAGYALGKHGADILVPGALAKVANKSVKSAQELVAVCKNLQIVQETLVLETAAGIGSGAKIAEVVRNGQTMMALAEDVGLTAREMGQLKQAGKLETTVSNRCENISRNPMMRESIEAFKKAEAFLEPYSKGFMSEIQARELIYQTGMRTFQRPAGIPENFLVRVTNRGAGMEYMHPINTHISIRVMPGKPHSPFPYQQKPYIVHKKDGKAFDKHGNMIEQKAPEAHIPVDEFIYRN